MLNMIRELKLASGTLTDEQQIQTMIFSLPNSWEYMRVNLTHNESVKNFEDVARHLDLEEERLDVVKTLTANIVGSNFRKTSGFKRNRTTGIQSHSGPAPKKAKNTKRKRSKRGSKKDKTKMTCYNCNQLGHFAHDCTEPKKTQEQQTT